MLAPRGGEGEEAAPAIFEAINRNGLVVFLVVSPQSSFLPFICSCRAPSATGSAQSGNKKQKSRARRKKKTRRQTDPKPIHPNAGQPADGSNQRHARDDVRFRSGGGGGLEWVRGEFGRVRVGTPDKAGGQALVECDGFARMRSLVQVEGATLIIQQV